MAKIEKFKSIIRNSETTNNFKTMTNGDGIGTGEKEGKSNGLSARASAFSIASLIAKNPSPSLRVDEEEDEVEEEEDDRGHDSLDETDVELDGGGYPVKLFGYKRTQHDGNYICLTNSLAMLRLTLGMFLPTSWYCLPTWLMSTPILMITMAVNYKHRTRVTQGQAQNNSNFDQKDNCPQFGSLFYQACCFYFYIFCRLSNFIVTSCPKIGNVLIFVNPENIQKSCTFICHHRFDDKLIQ